MATDSFEVGTRAIAQVGRNEIEVEVLAAENGTYLVRNNASREFRTARLEHFVSETLPEDDNTTATNPAPESGDGPRPEKKLSLLNAAAKVLETLRVPLNTKEMVTKATEMGLWSPTDAKTPEQTLYSGIFRFRLLPCATRRYPKW